MIELIKHSASTWRIREGQEHNFIDGRTMVHHLHLLNPVTGGEHNIEILLGCPSCPACKRPFARNEVTVDPITEVEKALEMLEENYLALMSYAAKYKLPVRLGPLAQGVGRTLIAPDGQRFLDMPEMLKLAEGK